VKRYIVLIDLECYTSAQLWKKSDIIVDNQPSTSGKMRNKRVVVVGAGIGGLTCALAFAQRGADVYVYEQASALKEIGAGIQVAPNGNRVLAALGLNCAIESSSIVAQAVVPTDGLSGKVIARFDLTGQEPQYRFFHRAALVGLIGQGALAAGVVIKYGVHVKGIAENGSLNTNIGDIPCDLCVFADGFHSVSRLFLGNIVKPEFTGQVAWRATIATKDVEPVARIWMAPNRHVVTYPLAEGILNIVAVQERETWAQEGWKHADDPDNMRAAFGDLCPELIEILGHVDKTYLWGLFRHPVAKYWHSDRLVILGDAAHPTLPFLAQGANLAIEDGYVLARCCDEVDNLDAALALFQQERTVRVSRAIAVANDNARNYHLSGIKRRVAHIGLKTLGILAPNAFLKRLDWLYGFDATK
jgi:salicylate hydroxylase